MKKVATAREDINKHRMEENITDGFIVDKDTFDEVVKKFKSNNIIRE